jgi:hypothetical protein
MYSELAADAEILEVGLKLLDPISPDSHYWIQFRGTHITEFSFTGLTLLYAVSRNSY